MDLSVHACSIDEGGRGGVNCWLAAVPGGGNGGSSSYLLSLLLPHKESHISP